jgi:AcrR family transcriptional regulator
MQPPDKKSDPPSRRQDILDHAVDLFVLQGYAGTSMADLANATGMQKASLYHHFPSKEALFVACVTEGFAGAVRRLEDIRADATLDDTARIRVAMEEIYRVNLTTPVGRMAPLVAEVAATIPDIARAFHGGFIASHYELITGMIDDGIARGSFAPLDTLGLRQMIFGPVIFLAMEREMTASFPDRDALSPVDRIRESHIDLILRLLTGASTSQRAKA